MQDSPVKYRGVPIGRVESIRVAPDGKLIQVVLKIETHQALDQHIVAQLRAVGITGTVFVELERKIKGGVYRSPKITFPTQYPVIASERSEMSNLLSGISDVLQEMRNLDLRDISIRMKQVLETLDKKMADMDVKNISNKMDSVLGRMQKIVEPDAWTTLIHSFQASAEALGQTMNQAGKLVKRITILTDKADVILTENRDQIKTALSNFRIAMEKADKVMGNANAFIQQTDLRTQDVYQRIRATAHNLEQASEELQQLLDLISNQPSLLLFGTPPRPRVPVRENGQ
jgi:phospholipid/cholesterol/gamma-HCH transport system substrate-binding protein